MTIPEGGVYPIIIYQGADYSESFQLLEEDEVTPIPFPAGTIAYGQIRDRPGHNELRAEFETEVIEETGIVKLMMSDVVTSTLTKPGSYDVFIVTPTEHKLFIQGKIIIDPRVTVIE